ncbi:MAG: COR domain-containing protein [Cytophagales bacterium]|nr:COR domain-containing protein [Cytophagales bacterium]
MSEEALRLIHEEKKERTGKLDLGFTGLSEIPKEVFELTWLRELNLMNYYIEDGKFYDSEQDIQSNSLNIEGIPESIKKLEQLEDLRIGNIPKKDLNTSIGIFNIDALKHLKNLKKLDLSNCHDILDYYSISNLKQLEYLTLDENRLTDINFIEGLNRLRSLSLSQNNFDDIEVLKTLPDLEVLDLKFNRVFESKHIGYLQRLRTLNFGDNNLSTFNPSRKLSSLQTLNLERNNLEDLRFIERTPNLRSLNLDNNQFSSVNRIANLSKLEVLELNYNNVSNTNFLPDLHNLQYFSAYSNQIEYLSEDYSSNQLLELNLGGNPLKSLSFLKQLPKIKSLYLHGTNTSNIDLSRQKELEDLILGDNNIDDISFLDQLNKIEVLNLSNNQITDISPLKNLKGLVELNLSYNKIVNIDHVNSLTRLEYLNLASNEIRDLSRLVPLLKRTKLDVNSFDGHYISIQDNPISTPSPEIVNQGRKAILEWFEANKAKLNEVKLILIGDPKAGKTSLLRRLKDGSFDENEPQTDGINIEDIEFGTCPSFPDESALKDITGHFWDFGGQEIMNSTHQFFLTNRSVYILVLDARKDKQVSNQVRNWVQRIRATGGNSPIIVIANQIDINKGFGFENEANLREEFPQIKGFLKVSCLDGENIEKLVMLLEEWIPKAEMFETEIDERWLPIKKQLEEETKKKKEEGRYLDESSFHKICKFHGLDNKTSQESLVKFLHDLGLLLHFEGIRKNLKEYYVLDPYWITYGVYQILTSSYAGERKGIVSINRLEYIINDEPDKQQIYQPKNYEKIKYSPNQRQFLLDILNEFKLCFYVNDRQHFIIPDLLETNAPEEITQPFRKSTKALRFIYQYTYIPSSIIPEIMVETHGMLEHIWRTGCVLSHDGSRAMINAYQNQILIIVEGEAKKNREFMSIIRFLIDQINRKFSDSPKMLIPLPDLENEFVRYKQLRNLERKGITTYSHYIEEKDDNILYSVSQLLEGIVSLNKEDNSMAEGFKKLQSMLQQSHSKLDLIYEQQVEHYEYLKTNLPPDWDERLLDEITSLQIEQTDEIRQELIKALARAFELHHGDMDEKVKEIFLRMNEPKKLASLKLKVGLPLLASMVPGLSEIPDVPGIPKVSVDAEFDLKAWSEQMYKKHELQFFKVMGKI